MTRGDRPEVCLVTGGAGFIGCALSTRLADSYDRVVAMDSLHAQVHQQPAPPPGLDERIELRVADITTERAWDALLAEMRPTVVIHLAAETGTAQSLTESSRHSLVNVVGTTRMLDAFVRHDAIPATILLTSSRAVYGEGEWVDENGASHYPGQRSAQMLESAQWDFPGLSPRPFEASRTIPRPTSVYAATKLAQEHLLSSWCLSFGASPIVLRLQNVYGPGQSLSNPYTGVVSRFATLARAGEEIPVYEDGRILRDFVFVEDVVQAVMRALEVEACERPYDVGSGQTTSILDLAWLVAEVYDAPAPRVTGAFRNGDVRAASVDIDATMVRLGWSPGVDLREGVLRFCRWVDADLGAGPGARMQR